MNTGMLWLDDDSRRSFDDKVVRAAEYYQEKYGRFPELCLVNKKMLTGDKKNVGHIEVQPTNTVLIHHFWLGMRAN